MANSWKGWSGEKTWETFEKEVMLSVTHDYPIFLRIENIFRDYLSKIDRIEI